MGIKDLTTKITGNPQKTSCYPHLSVISFFTKTSYNMKDRGIAHSRREVEIYKAYYKPSFNLLRFFKAILGVFIFGRTSVAHSYIPIKKRPLK